MVGRAEIKESRLARDENQRQDDQVKSKGTNKEPKKEPRI